MPATATAPSPSSEGSLPFHPDHHLTPAEVEGQALEAIGTEILSRVDYDKGVQKFRKLYKGSEFRVVEGDDCFAFFRSLCPFMSAEDLKRVLSAHAFFSEAVEVVPSKQSSKRKKKPTESLTTTCVLRVDPFSETPREFVGKAYRHSKKETCDNCGFAKDLSRARAMVVAAFELCPGLAESFATYVTTRRAEVKKRRAASRKAA